MIKSATIPEYHKFIVGVWRLSLPIVCTDGIIRSVRIEEYTDGLHIFLAKDDGDYTNHKGYKSSKSAIIAASRWGNDMQNAPDKPNKS